MHGSNCFVILLAYQYRLYQEINGRIFFLIPFAWQKHLHNLSYQTCSLWHTELFREEWRSAGTRISLLLSEIMSVSFKSNALEMLALHKHYLKNFIFHIFYQVWQYSVSTLRSTLKTLVQTKCSNCFNDTKVNFLPFTFISEICLKSHGLSQNCQEK